MYNQDPFITASPSMEANNSIRQLIWNGAIPLEIHLNDPENILTEVFTSITSIAPTSKTLKCPFYMMARRLLYFPILVNEIKRHFGSISRSTSKQIPSFTDESLEHEDSADVPTSSTSKSSMGSLTPSLRGSTNLMFSWFTCKIDGKEIVLPSHLPIGLIYDLFRALNHDNNVESISNAQDQDLPWQIEFHISNNYSHYNSFCHELMDNPLIAHASNSSNPNPISSSKITLYDESNLSAFYFSSLKEADHLRSGSARNVMNLTRSEQLQLWDSLKEGDCFKFWRINQKLIQSTTNTSTSTSTSISKTKSTIATSIISNTRSIPVKFWIVIDGREIIRLQFPIQFNYNTTDLTLKRILKLEFDDSFLDRIKEVSSHGVRFPSLEIDLLDLSSNWAYSDNFVNLLIKLR